MKKIICILFLIALVTPETVLAQTADNPFEADLIAGGGNEKSAIDVGDVLVWNDADSIHVKYVTIEPWCISETHLQIETSPDMIPQNNGNPVPGLFDYKGLHDCVTSYTATIALGDWPQGTDLYIAAHAEVQSTIFDNDESIVLEESAWGAGLDFSGKNWSSYLIYEVQSTFDCGNFKPIESLTMIWGGGLAVHIKAWKGDVGDILLAEIGPIYVGEEVTVSGYGLDSQNDVVWEIFDANTNLKIGESNFHISCSDEDMNGPEDCGKPQGNAKDNDNLSLINDWLFEGMTGNGLSLDCTPPSSSIGDYVWSDTNNNGIQDAGEPGLIGVLVELEDCSGTVLASTVTGPNGFYEFTGLSQGDYLIRFIPLAGYSFVPKHQGADPAVDSDADQLTGETDCILIDFGEEDNTIDAGFHIENP